ncbi:unnamed protein product, partial [Bubo scandiacus]
MSMPSLQTPNDQDLDLIIHQGEDGRELGKQNESPAVENGLEVRKGDKTGKKRESKGERCIGNLWNDMIFTAKLILYARVGLVTKRRAKAVCLPSLYQFLVPELPGAALISGACSLLRSALNRNLSGRPSHRSCESVTWALWASAAASFFK